ncbi:ADP-ribosyltransferase [Kitasatospora sp. NPDC088783]|uniref:ADP-ribosyltransferase n=1 Tax=Kitasatospora sp. NPDC088783 TaxID=3364077 RepID=UPI0038023C54
MRLARRASAGLAGETAGLAADDAAALAFGQARQWEARARDAAAEGDDAAADLYAGRARDAAAEARRLLDGRTETAVSEDLEHERAADALASATGLGERAVALPRLDGGCSVIWDEDGFSGSATVHPGGEGGHPITRIAFTGLDRDRYEALARSPWPYEVEDGRVVYDNMPADQAELIVRAAATGRPGRPWEEHGLDGGGRRDPLEEDEARGLVRESASWAGRLDGEEAYWTREYAGADAFEPINRHLYEGHGMDEPVDEVGVPMSQIAPHLDSALAKARVAGEPRTTYRGFNPPDEVIAADCVKEWAADQFPVGGTYRDDSYMSTSHCPRMAIGFSANLAYDPQAGEYRSARHHFAFEVLSSKGAVMRAVSDIDEDEYERLLPRSSTFRVVGRQVGVQIPDHYGKTRSTVLVQLVDVDDIPRY